MYFSQIVLPGVLLRVCQMLTLFSVPKAIRMQHYDHNCKVWNAELQAKAMKGIYIEKQALLAQMHYGCVKNWLEKNAVVRCGIEGDAITADYNSCEAIAVYNAIVANGRECDFSEILLHFEAHGVMLYGYLGTSVLSMKKYLIENAFRVEVFTGRDCLKAFSDTNTKFNTFIITLYNDYRSIKCQIHTMCVTKENGEYVFHNSFSNTAIRSHSIEILMNEYGKGFAKVISVIGVRNFDI